MPAFSIRIFRKGHGKANTASARLSRLGKAVADLVANAVRGLVPAPALQPIPVRVSTRQRRY